MTIEIIGLLILLALLMWVVWLYDRKKKAHEDAVWEISVLKEKLSQRRLESDE